MAEEKPSLHIDLDWKKQAQEDKRRLEEEEKKRAEERAAAAAAPAAPIGVVPTAGAAAATAAAGSPAKAGAKGRARGQRELPPASIATLAQSLATQSLYYLGDAAAARPGSEEANMDMAKHLIDTLGVLEQKTVGHLTPEEQQAVDLSLYETRMRFIAVAGQVIAGS